MSATSALLPTGLSCDEPDKKEDKVADLCQRLNCQLMQANGQRILGPPGDWVGPAPLKGSEVFVGRLPRDMLEDEIVPVFQRMGKIYQVRVMMDFSGFNRGYGFVEYSCKEEADRAIKELNDYEIRRSHRIGVVRSVDNCRLFFGGLPRHLTKADIYENVNRLVPNVKDVIVYTSADDLSQNRGFCFVEFNDHKSAAMARRNLIPMRNDLFKCPLNIDWAVPEPEIDEETMKTVKNLYVRNLTASVTEEQLMDLFDTVKPGSVERVVIKRHYAFVNFHERSDALAAIEKLNDTYLEGSVIQVSLAKPAANFQQETNRLRHYSQSNGDRREMQDMVRMQYDPSGISMFLQRNPNGRMESQRNAQRRTPKYDMMTPPPTNNSLYGRMVNGTQQSLMATVTNGRAPIADWHRILPKNISYVALLERLCQSKGYGEPNFRVTLQPKKDVSSGRDVNYYIYQVSAPGWGNGRWLHPPSLMDSEGAAKELAAQFALLRLSYPTMDDQEIAMEMMKSGVLAQENQLPDVTVPPPPSEVVGRPNLRSKSAGTKSFSTGIGSSPSYESLGSGSPRGGLSYSGDMIGGRNRLNPSAPEFVLNSNVVNVHKSYGYPPMGNSPSIAGSAGPMQSFFYPQSPPSYPPPSMSMWPQKGGEGLDCARMMRAGFNDSYGGNKYRSPGGNGRSADGMSSRFH